MKLYIAGSLIDEKMSKSIKTFKENGFEITHDWTRYIGNDKEQSSFDNINGVRDADALVVIMNHDTYEYREVFCEIGCALGLSKLIVVVNDNPGNYYSNLCFYN